jgi:hypothetical protein
VNEGRGVEERFSEYSPEKKNSESLQRSEETKILESDVSEGSCCESSVDPLNEDLRLFELHGVSTETFVPYDILLSNTDDETTDEESVYSADEDCELDRAMKENRYWYVVRDIICNHQKWGVKCPCMYAFRIDKKRYFYDSASLNDLFAINMELRLNVIALTQKRNNKLRYRQHKLVLIALTTKDKFLVCDPKMERGAFLAAIYELRAHYEIFSDFGQKDQIVEPTFEGQGFGSSITEIIRTITSTVWNYVSTGVKTVGDLVVKAMSEILGKIKSLIGLISETLANALDSIVDRIKTAIVRTFKVSDFIPDILKKNEWSSLIVIMCVLLVIIAIDAIGVLAYRLATRVVDNLIKYYSEKDDFVGESPEPNMCAGIITLCGLVLGLTFSDLSTLSKRARELTSLVTAGLSGSFLLSSLFIILPITIQTALKVKFGSAEVKERILIEDWMLKSNAVNRLKKVPKILVSEEYYEWCKDLHRQAIEMRGSIKTQANGHMFLKNYVSLMETLTLLESYRDAKSSRDYPYSLHLCAPPGYGKTLLVNKLCIDLFGVSSREIYTRPVASEYWDGYLDQKIVIMDEFLIGENTDKIRIAKEYLELVSTKAFIPNFASVDNPAVGIKGTQAEPIGVITINNTPYQKVSNVEQNALWRRREFVIQLQIAKGFDKYLVGSKIDLSSMTTEQIKEKAWLTFDLLPAQPNCGEAIRDLSYSLLVKTLKDHYHRFTDTCRLIRTGNESDICAPKSPIEMLDDMMRELRGIPNEPQSLSDSIIDFFGNFVFGAQAPGPEQQEDKVSESSNVSQTSKMDKNVNSSPLWKPETGNPYRLIWNRLRRILKKTKVSREYARKTLIKIYEDFETMDSSNEVRDYYLSSPNSASLSEAEKWERKMADSKLIRTYIRHKSERYRLELDLPSSSTDEFETCSESSVEPLTSQKDIISFIDHSNVDPTKIHRHKCLGIFYEPVLDKNERPMADCFKSGEQAFVKVQCPANFAHKHEEHITHKFLCPTCISKGYPQVYDKIHGTATPKANKSSPDLIPYDYEWEYQDGNSEYREKLDKMWLDIYVDKFLSYGREPIILLNDPELGLFGSIPSVKDTFYSQIRSVSIWVSIFVVIHGVRRFFSKDKNTEAEICFGQSSPPNQSSGSRRQARNYDKYSNAHGQSGSQLTFIFNGVHYNAIPIKGKTFLTYAHAFLLPDGTLIPQGTEMKIKWNGVVESTTLNYECMLRPSDGDDLVFYTHSCMKIAQFPDQVKKFWTIEDMEGFYSTQALINIEGAPCYTNVVLSRNKTYKYLGKMYLIPECLMYKFPTKRGDCGSVITSVGQCFPNKIMGMHIAGGGDGTDSFGLALIVTREDVVAALTPSKFEEPDCLFEANGPLISTEMTGPNLESISYVPISDQITISRRSKISKSAISEDLMTSPRKFMPILSPNDVRANGKDPMVQMIIDTLDVEPKLVEDNLVETVKSSCLLHLKQKLRWPIGKRRLTFEEALQGVPGILASMRVKTSAGYPLTKLAKKRGKKDYFSFGPNGELSYEQFFRDMVEDYVIKLESEGINERRFLAFLKDELVTKAKLEQGRTRIIYCGDLVSNVAYRILFGHLLAAFNNSYLTTSSAVGLNQFSHDMHCMFDYLIEVGMNFVAGDFKNFDKRVQPQMQFAAYEILMDLVDEGITTPTAKKSFIEQQCHSPAQVLSTLIKFKTTHFSGCFFTTIVNNIIHELYLRYLFLKNCPTHVFEQNVRLKVCGDDHIYSFSDAVKDQMTPHKIRDGMEGLGQVYTSDIKDHPLEDRFRSFEEITFLGAHPVLVEGNYSGALKKTTIEECLHWTRNKNLTIRQEAQTVLELSSIWDETYYMALANNINYALKNAMIEPIDVIGWKEMRRIVSSRTAATGGSFKYGFEGQAPPINSLAKLNADKEIKAVAINRRDPKKLSKKALNEEAMKLEFGTDSRVFRTSFVWRTGDIEGVAIAQFDVPFGVLNLGDRDNLQNMPFDRFVYWNGDVELVFQLNASPFQQGLLSAYFVPLADYEVELANITTTTHVLIQPDQSATYSVMIPFKYLRSVMNTIARTTESLGTVFVTPISPLRGVDIDEVTITMYTSFPNSNFAIPRPVEGLMRPNKFYPVSGGDDIPEIISFSGSFEGQGNSSSSNINYNFSNVGGDMPVQGIVTDTNQTATQDISPDLDVSIPMPLDNPPLCSGAIPVEQSFPGMAASHGVRPTRDLQLKPATLSRQHLDIFNPAEAKIATLLSKKCLLRKFMVNSAMPAGTELYKITLNTRLGLAEGTNIPLNIAILNQFMFWKADIEFSFVSVQTQYHSVRLQSMTAYGAAGVSFGSRNVSYTNTMKFASDESGTKYVFNELIPFNQQTEFLRTYEGELVTDPIQNYSIGTYAVYIANALIAPPTVPEEVEVCLFVRFLNVKVAVPRANSPFTWNDYLDYTPSPVWLMQGYSTFSRREIREITSITSSTIISRRSGVDFIGDIPAEGNYTIKNTEEVRLGVLLRNSSLSAQTTHYFSTASVAIGTTYLTWIFEPPIPTLDWTPSPTPSLFTFDAPPLVLTQATFRSEITFVGQGPGLVEGTVTAEIIEDAAIIPVTKTEAKHRPNIPCKNEIGEKFEFCVSDVHEVLRRYIRMMPINNEALDQFIVESFVVGDGTQLIQNIPVQPQSHWRSLFAAWNGGIKYRVFKIRDRDFPQVVFNPYLNEDVNLPGVPIIDAINGLTFKYGNVSIESQTAITGPLAREVSYPISDASYIDVSAPFQSHYNFCYNSKTQRIAPISSGTLSFMYDNRDQSIPIIFTAAADDLRLGIFRPPRKTLFDQTVFVNGLAGFYNTNSMYVDSKRNEKMQVSGILGHLGNSMLRQKRVAKSYAKVEAGSG